MALNLPGLPQIFKHSRDSDTGLGKERVGAGEIIVSQDGTGDYDTLEEALRVVQLGGRIILKEGTYSLKAPITIPTGIVIQGQGFKSIIQTGTAAGTWFSLASKSNILIRDIKFDLRSAQVTVYDFNLTSSDSVTFEKCLFSFNSGSGATHTGLFYANPTASNLKVLNCQTEEIAGGIGEGLFLTAVTKAHITGNRFDLYYLNMSGDSVFTNCVIKSNYFYGFDIESGSNNNVVTGNQSDIAITNAGTGNQVANNCVF